MKKRTLILNAGTGILQIIVNIGLMMAMIPLFISRLGTQTYGVYALITAIGSVGIFVNFGFNTSLVKYLAEQGKTIESNYDIVVTLVILAITMLIFSIICVIGREFILIKLIGLSRELFIPSVYLFYIACIGATFFQILSLVPSAMLDAQQMVYITNFIQLIIGILNKLLIIVSLIVAPSLKTIGWIILFSALIGMVLFYIFAIRQWGKITYEGLNKVFFRIAKKHFIYGRGIYGSALLGFFYEPMTKILISRHIGVNEVGFFDIALRIRALFVSFFERLLYPILPLLANLSDLKEIKSIITEIQHKIWLLVIPTFALIIMITQPVINVWIGKNTNLISLSVILLVSTQLVSVVYSSAYHFLVIKGYPSKILILQSVNIFVNILLFILLVPHLGYIGAVLAYCIALLSSVVLCAYYQKIYIGNYSVSSNKQAIKFLLFGSTLLIYEVLIDHFIIGNWHKIIFQIILFVPFLILMIRVLSLVNRSDIQRYLGKNNTVSRFTSFLLSRE